MNWAQRSRGRARRRPACSGGHRTTRSKRMRIGIIGTGNVGGTLARKLTELGDQVRIANSRGPASLARLANETGARAVTIEDAVRDVQLVIVAIPEKSVSELPKGLFDRAAKASTTLTPGTTFRPYPIGASEPSSAAPPSPAW